MLLSLFYKTACAWRHGLFMEETIVNNKEYLTTYFYRISLLYNLMCLIAIFFYYLQVIYPQLTTLKIIFKYKPHFLWQIVILKIIHNYFPIKSQNILSFLAGTCCTMHLNVVVVVVLKYVNTLLQIPLHDTCSQSKTIVKGFSSIKGPRIHWLIEGGGVCQRLVAPAIWPGNGVPQGLA